MIAFAITMTLDRNTICHARVIGALFDYFETLFVLCCFLIRLRRQHVHRPHWQIGWMNVPSGFHCRLPVCACQLNFVHEGNATRFSRIFGEERDAHLVQGGQRSPLTRSYFIISDQHNSSKSNTVLILLLQNTSFYHCSKYVLPFLWKRNNRGKNRTRRETETRFHISRIG